RTGRLPHRRQSRPQWRPTRLPLSRPCLRRPSDEPSHGQHATTRRQGRRRGMMLRRLLLAGVVGAPAIAHAPGQASKSQARGFYASGTKQRAVRFAGGDGAVLAGTLLLPIRSELGRVPGIVLVAGSGPTDRDGNNPLAGERINLLRQIAELLAGVGIATLRYD